MMHIFTRSTDDVSRDVLLNIGTDTDHECRYGSWRFHCLRYAILVK